VVRERLDIAVLAEFVDQPRRSLNVGEEEGDFTARQFGTCHSLTTVPRRECGVNSRRRVESTGATGLEPARYPRNRPSDAWTVLSMNSAIIGQKRPGASFQAQCPAPLTISS